MIRMFVMTALLLVPQQQGPMTEAGRLNREGKTAEARKLIASVMDTMKSEAAKSNAHRSMAISYAYDGDCTNAVKHEQEALAYWKSREQAEPQNAFYQEGEVANEAARICIDAGDLKTADKWYRAGYEMGNKEPAPRTHSKALWDFRLAHALGRLAARRGDKAEAQKQIKLARAALDSDTAMASQQERFFPYLTGYVALYTNDLQTAEADLSKAIAMPGNERDPFMRFLLAMTHEKMGHAAVAKKMYQEALDLATVNNPPAAFVRRNAPAKLR